MNRMKHYTIYLLSINPSLAKEKDVEDAVIQKQNLFPIQLTILV
jgi:hypothetical protein